MFITLTTHSKPALDQNSSNLNCIAVFNSVYPIRPLMTLHDKSMLRFKK